MEELYLVHHGVKGQKWGVRRYQNPDGTLTEAGKRHYGAEEYDKKTKENYKENRYSNDYSKRTPAKQDHYANAAAKLLMRKDSAEKYSNYVKNGRTKTSAFINAYADSYLKDFRDYSMVGVGSAVVGSLIAGPTGGILAASYATYGMEIGKNVSRISRTYKYLK